MSDESVPALVERAQAYDRCWVEGRVDDLRRFLHPRVVFTGPRFERLAQGVEACVQSYAAFLSAARVHDLKTREYEVDVADECAVMTYRWTIDYEQEDGRHRESGQDLLVWLRRQGQWEIVWRSQQPDR